jgi:hypothetical protein
MPLIEWEYDYHLMKDTKITKLFMYYKNPFYSRRMGLGSDDAHVHLALRSSGREKCMWNTEPITGLATVQ